MVTPPPPSSHMEIHTPPPLLFSRPQHLNNEQSLNCLTFLYIMHKETKFKPILCVYKAYCYQPTLSTDPNLDFMQHRIR